MVELTTTDGEGFVPRGWIRIGPELVTDEQHDAALQAMYKAVAEGRVKPWDDMDTEPCPECMAHEKELQEME